jgi:hypothetical protein
MAVKFALFAGILIQDEISGQIDIDGDGQFSDAELRVWIDNVWGPTMSMSLDAQTSIAIDSTTAHASVLGDPSLVLLSQPLLIEVDVPVPMDGLPHQLLIRNDYESHRSDYDLQVLTAPGAEGEQLSNNGRIMVVEFETDPEAEGGELSQASFSSVLNSAEPSVMDRITDNLLWIGLGVLGLAVVGWLGYLRLAERRAAQAEAAAKAAKKSGSAKSRAQAETRSAQKVRQSQASKKKPVAVKTIDAPDE